MLRFALRVMSVLARPRANVLLYDQFRKATSFVCLNESADGNISRLRGKFGIPGRSRASHLGGAKLTASCSPQIKRDSGGAYQGARHFVDRRRCTVSPKPMSI
jgi:hypothetical protein